jgi:hypothetical protein
VGLPSVPPRSMSLLTGQGNDPRREANGRRRGLRRGQRPYC